MMQLTFPLPVLLAAVVFVGNATVLYAQDTEQKETSPDANEQKEKKDKPDPFALPEDTSAKSLFAFMNTVKRTPPAKGVKPQDHLGMQIAAVVKAAEAVIAGSPDEADETRAITEKLGALNVLARVKPAKAKADLDAYMEELKTDERPFIVAMVKARAFSQKISSVRTMKPEEQQEVIAEFFEMIEADGLSRETVSMSSGLGRALGSTGNPEVGVAFYNRLADVMEGSKEFSSRAGKMRGAARRLGLPGNFMDLMGTTTDGEEFDWASYRGKVVLVDFWASWCGPCRGEIPNMKKQLEAYGEKGFAIVGINLDRTLDKCNEYVEKEGLTWENLFTDEDGKRGWDTPMADYYGITGIPTAILVDKEGKVISMSARGRTLNKLLAEALGEPEKTADGEAAGEE